MAKKKQAGGKSAETRRRQPNAESEARRRRDPDAPLIDPRYKNFVSTVAFLVVALFFFILNNVGEEPERGPYPPTYNQKLYDTISPSAMPPLDPSARVKPRTVSDVEATDTTNADATESDAMEPNEAENR
jgi:hypothetical protein